MSAAYQSHERPEPFFKRGISMGEAFAFLITLLGTIIGVYINVQIRLHDVEVGLRMNKENIETRDTRNDKSFEKINAKLDDIQTSLYDIKIQLQRKQDKP